MMNICKKMNEKLGISAEKSKLCNKIILEVESKINAIKNTEDGKKEYRR